MMRRPSLAVLALLVAPAFGSPLARPVVGIDDVTAWHAAPSEGVKVSLSSAPGAHGQALRVDFDFSGTAGYAAVRRKLPLELPPNFEFSFYIRGTAPANNLQFKLLDDGGDNVWWVNWPDYEFPADWRRVTIKKRQIRFAWGPSTDHSLKSVAALEFVVSAGSGGGHGTVLFDGLEFRELPPELSVHPDPVLQASSALPPSTVAAATDGDPNTAWHSDPRSGSSQFLTLDLRERREFGGLTIAWQGKAYASRYDVEVSDDGLVWRAVRRVTAGRGGHDFLCLPDAETRFVRLHLIAGPAPDYAIAEVALQERAFCASPEAFFQTIARAAPRGNFPRGMSGEQSYWTVVGVDGAAEKALFSEDGALEPGRGRFSIEPFVYSDGGLLSWANVEIEHSLEDGYLPIPTVQWRKAGVSLRITAFATGSAASSAVLAEYELANEAAASQDLTLALAVRPFQVNPPAQFLNSPGGTSQIRSIAWDDGAFAVNGQRSVFPLRRPDEVAAVSFDGGQIPELLAARALPTATTVADDFGYASGVLVYHVHLGPGEHATFGLVVPLPGSPPVAADAVLTPAWFAARHTQTANEWRRRLNLVTLRVPEAEARIANTVRSALAHILIERDGPALQPGPRSYRRTWIRDGALMSSALLRLGHADEVKEFLRWYAPRQFDSGKVPCCVDARGADPVAENDSHGELIYLAAEVERYTHDRPLLEELWPRIAAAVTYMRTLRQSERTVQNEAPERRELFGLLPASISHEGYSDKPMHSYWDDFWALRGYKDALEIATLLGHTEAARRLSAECDEFQSDLYASLRASVAKHQIHFVPGSAELGDFDATSTTVALSPGGEQERLPPALLQATFERYWQEFTERRDGKKPWDAYTPYELRIVGTFVRLGWRARGQQLLDYFLSDRRPAEWNQWAEVVGRDARQARFIGDMPHGWVASDFIRSTLDLFAYSRESDRALVIAAGVPRAWFQGDGSGIDNLRTEYGKLSFTLVERGQRVVLKVAPGLRIPPGGIVFSAPWDSTPRRTLINGRGAEWRGDELRIRELPATVSIQP